MWHWFRSWRYFQRHDDAYARNRELLANSIRNCIELQKKHGRTIWLLAHGDDVFEQTQRQLSDWGFDYELVMSPIDIDELLLSNDRSKKLLSTDTIKLVHAQLIPSTQLRDHPRENVPSEIVAMFVLDRHRDIENDDRIESFCRNVPLRFELGYFLSLEDELVSEVLDEMTLEVLEQMGMGQHELITSTLVTMRLNRYLRRKKRSS